MVYLQNPIKHIGILEYISMYHKDDLNVCSVDELEEIYKEEYERQLATLDLNKAAVYIRYDEDGVMVWDGKRCEAAPFEDDDPEYLELLEMLKEFE